MLSSTFELITMVASNSLLVFLLCNFIIVVLLIASSLETSQLPETKPFVSPHPHYDYSHSQIISEKTNATSLATYVVDTPQKKDRESESLSVKIDEVKIDVAISRSNSLKEENIEEEEEEEEEDELHKRAEDFIKKLKQLWKEEKLGKSVV